VPITISQSAIKAWRRCKRQYYYKHIEELESRLPGLPLKRGNWLHSLLAVHYKGGDWEIEHRKLTRQFKKLFLEEREFYGDLPDQAERMMKAYLYHWRDQDEDWEILHVEETFEVISDSGDTFSFKPDLVIVEKSTGHIGCWDHKSTKGLPDADWRIQDLQSGLYPWGLRLAGLDVDYFGFNYIRTKVPTTPHINLDGSISKAKLDTDYYTLAAFLKEYYADEWPKIPPEWKIRLRTLKVDNRYFKRSRVNKTGPVENRLVQEMDYTSQEIESYLEFAKDMPDADPWTRTMIMSCDWDCDFHDLCMVELLGGDGKFMRRSKYQQSKYAKERRVGKQTPKKT